VAEEMPFNRTPLIKKFIAAGAVEATTGETVLI
jgi:hypothetical protein